MKSVLIINGHPKKNSFCDLIIDEYIKGIKENPFYNKYNVLNVRDLNLESFLKNPHTNYKNLSAEILSSQNLISQADLLVFVYPNWWGSPPGLLKVFIENVFTPGFAFKFHPPKLNLIPTWDKLLVKKSAKLLVTMDSPPLFYKYVFGDPNYKMMKHNLLNFCGIKPVKRYYFGPLKLLSEKKREKLLHKAYKLGTRK